MSLEDFVKGCSRRLSYVSTVCEIDSHTKNMCKWTEINVIAEYLFISYQFALLLPIGNEGDSWGYALVPIYRAD